MLEQKIYVLADDDIVLMFSLLGIDGKIVESPDDFREIFDELIDDDSIGIILIALKLPTAINEFLVEFKLNKKRPLIFILPNLFSSNIETDDIMKNSILESIGDIISY